MAQHKSAAASGVGSVEAEKENTQAVSSASTSLRGTWITEYCSGSTEEQPNNSKLKLRGKEVPVSS